MKQNIFFLLIIILLGSCYKDIDIFNNQIYEPKLGISGVLMADSTVKVWVYKTSSPGNFADSNILSNASVRLYEDGDFLENLSFIYLGKTGYYQSSALTKAGHVYRIEAEALGKMAWAEDTLPQKPQFQIMQVQVIDTSSYVIYMKKQKSLLNIKMRVKWFLPQTKDYYYAFAGYSVVDTMKNWFSLVGSDVGLLRTSDIIPISLPMYYSSNTVSAFLYKPIFYKPGDLEFTLSLRTTADMIANSVTLYFVTARLSRALYDFYYSYDLYNRSLYNPFVEPVNVKVNVNNGLGLFAGLSFSIDSVKINF